MKEKHSTLVDFAVYVCDVVEKTAGMKWNAQKMVYKFAQKNGSRSHQQLSMYWALYLKKIMYHFPEHLGSPKNTDEVHGYLKDAFCFTRRKDLLREARGIDGNGKMIKVMVSFSAALDKLPQKDFNDYMDFVKTWVEKNIGDFNEVMQSEDA